jgi:hypothetical protein
VSRTPYCDQVSVLYGTVRKNARLKVSACFVYRWYSLERSLFYEVQYSTEDTQRFRIMSVLCSII